jgi:hemerythrin-like domain-containing protein
MKRHHAQIEKLLRNFQTKLKSKSSDVTVAFNSFKFELEKHFFLEEKAIFTFIYSDDKDSNEMKLELLEEHNLILDMIQEVESDLNNDSECELSKITKMLKCHRSFEDETFYPKLDQELDPTKKKQIIDRITNPF